MQGCDHPEAPFGAATCQHLVPARREPSVEWLQYFRWLTGDGLETQFVCPACLARREAGSEIVIVSICGACLEQLIDDVGDPQGVRGRAGVRVREAAVTSRVVELVLPQALAPAIDCAPVDDSPNVWLVLGAGGGIWRCDVSSGRWEELDHVQVPDEPAHKPWMGHALTHHLHVAPTGAFVAVVNDYGTLGTVHHLGRGATLRLNGGDYHPETVPFSFAFVERGGRTIAIHRTMWNRLDASDAETGRLLTERAPTSYRRGEPRPVHYLDYFHGRLAVSPDGRRIVDDGWVWHPFGVPIAWSLDAWLDDNEWESEDGPSLVTLCQRAYYWDHGLCWLDPGRIAVAGLGDDDLEIVDGARIFLAGEPATESRGRRRATAAEATPFPGPSGSFLSDGRHLFSSASGALDVWDASDGARIARVEGFEPRRRHPRSGEFVQVDAAVLRAGTVTTPT